MKRGLVFVALLLLSCRNVEQQVIAAEDLFYETALFWGIELPTPAFETVVRLRDNVGRAVNWGSPRSQLGEKVFTGSWRQLEQMFEDDVGATMCQGAAYLLHLRYLERGYRSFLVGFDNEVFSHVMVLVEVERDDGSIALVVQDPSFNVSYVDADTDMPLSIFEIISALGSHNHRKIKVANGVPAEVRYLRHKDDPKPDRDYEYIGPSLTNASFSVYSAVNRFDTYAIEMGKAFSASGHIQGFGESILYPLFRYPVYVWKGYPMNNKDKQDAELVFFRLKALYDRLGLRWSPDVTSPGLTPVKIDN